MKDIFQQFFNNLYFKKWSLSRNCKHLHFLRSGYFAVDSIFAITIHVYLNGHICYNFRSDIVERWIMQLPSTAMITGLNLHWQCTLEGGPECTGGCTDGIQFLLICHRNLPIRID